MQSLHFPLVSVVYRESGGVPEAQSVFIAERQGHIVPPMGTYRGVYYYTLDDLQLLINQAKAAEGWNIDFAQPYDNYSQGQASA